MREPGMRIDVRWVLWAFMMPIMLLFPDAYGGFFLAAAVALPIGVFASSVLGRKEKLTVGDAISRRHEYWRERRLIESLERDLEAYSPQEQLPLRALLRESGCPNLPLYPKGLSSLSSPANSSQDYE